MYYSATDLLKPIAALSKNNVRGITLGDPKASQPICGTPSLSGNKAMSHPASNFMQPIAALRCSQGLAANPKNPSTSLSIQRALSHSASNFQQPMASPRGSDNLKANPKSPNTILSANRSLLPSPSNLQQPVYKFSRRCSQFSRVQ